MKTLKKILALALATLMLFSVVSCKDPASDPNPTSATRIYTLNGTTGFGMAKLMNDNAQTNKYTFTVKADASDVTAAIIAGEADIAALPTNAASNLYNVTNGGVKILAINTLGCLYLLNSTGEEINSLADLEGKTVYVPAQNPTFILTHLKQANDLGFTIDSTSYAQPAALRDAVANGSVQIAVLPEPMVTIAISKAKTNSITVVNELDLTAEWNKINPENSLVQGCIVVRKEYLEKNPAAVESFLNEYKASIEYLQNNTADAARMIAEQKIFENQTVAEKAIPKCNITYMDGEAMKSAMQIYLGILKDINAKAIGGALPADDFYYNAQS